MKTRRKCQNCAQFLNIAVPIDRDYCFKCLPAGSSDTTKLLTMLKNGTELECQNCNKTYIYKRNYSTRQLCGNCRSNVRNRVQKQLAIDYLGGKCSVCGYNKYNGALTFHHVNPKEKSFTIARNISRGWIRLQKELDKCKLLCANCHAEEHQYVAE